jgi:competence protein ComER
MKTGFVGLGSMGGMLVRALLRAGALSPKDVCVSNRSPQKLAALAAEFPGLHLATNRELAENCELIFLCVKASDVPTALAQMDAELYPGQLLVTTASVISLRALEDRVPCRVAKLIPSITQEVKAGIALLVYGSRATHEDRRALDDLLELICHPVVIPEALSRPAINLTSSGPALIAYLLQSMAEEAVRANAELSLEMAQSFIQETAAATLQLMSRGKMGPEEVVHCVAVPGGMTAMSLEILSRFVPQAWQMIFAETAQREREAREVLVL